MASTRTTDVTSTDNDGWEDVPSETQMVFDTDGDEFIGVMQGWSETDSGIAQAHFVNDDGTFFVNCGWDLKRQLKEVKKGTLTRIRRVGERDTGQKSPMVLYKVATKRS